MEMRRGKFFLNILILTLMVIPFGLYAQEHRAGRLVHVGDSLRMNYCFESSLEAYGKALDMVKDTVLTIEDSLFRIMVNDRIRLSENGRSMADFVDSPTVVAKRKFSVNDFFLYYPLQDKVWRKTPNQLDSLPSYRFSRALYAPEDATVIYYSASDGEGIRNIYRTEKTDSLWSVPSLLNEQITSASDEIYPMLSPDGRALYFASKGLYGVGGYDLYVSEWNEETQDWAAPVNMGFPYSSPADDFLFINTEDGEHTIFASNRDCHKDSVWVYVLAFDNMPVRKSVDDPRVLAGLSRLDPESDEDIAGGEDEVNADIPENVDTRRYMQKMSEMRALRDSISHYEAMLDNDRNQFAMSTDADERITLTNAILRREARIPEFRDSLEKVTVDIQKIEMEFLFSGVVIDPDKLMAEADREIVGEATSYTFSKKSMGAPLSLDMMKPKVEFDYSFMILEEGRFAEDNTIPGGIVYQIQMYSAGTKATVKTLKGLSPVFEHRTASGRYIYRVGLFRKYSDVLANLNAVKRAGFRTAFIVAFEDGKEIPVSKARTLEAQKKEVASLYQIEILPSSGELDDVVVSGLMQQARGKDLARVEREDGVVVYVLGPFQDKALADSVVSFASSMGAGDVKCVVINQEN